MSVGMRRGFQVDAISYEEMMRARAAYFGCVSYLDEVIGDLLMRLEADGLLENTIIVYTSDHGEMAGEHGVWWKNGWYEACTRVPLLISSPEQRRGERSPCRWRTPVGLIDLFPTLCRLAGAEIPGGLEGTDLTDAVRGKASPTDRPICCDALTPRWGTGTEFRMVRQGNYKYVRFRESEPLFFNLADDPGEQHNLTNTASGADAEALKSLQNFAERSMDFDAAERERLERDANLHEQYPQNLPNSAGNLYLMPSGKLVNAEDALYHPTVISDDPADAFVDWPGA